MRILAIHMNSTINGGAEVVFTRGTRLLAERGHAVAWLTIGQLPPAIQDRDPAFCLPELEPGKSARLANLSRHFYNPASVQLAERALQEFAPDIVHLHTVFGYRHLSPAVLLPFHRGGIPIVQTLHDFGLLCPASFLLSHASVCEACKGGRYRHAALKRCLEGGRARSWIAAFNARFKDLYYHYDDLISAYIAPSAFLRQKYIEFGYAPAKVAIIPNAYFPPPAGQFAAGLPRGGYLLFVGRLSPEKGVDLLLQAAQGLGLPLKIVGAGDELPRLRELSWALKLDQVEFLGAQPHEKIADLFRRAAITVMPSRWYENGPLVILESFAQSTPVVAARIGALPEFVGEGETGFLFAANDPADLQRVLQRALAAPKVLRRMGENARQHVEQAHHPSLYAERLEKMLAEQLGANGDLRR